jgi:hypothetical protein
LELHATPRLKPGATNGGTKPPFGGSYGGAAGEEPAAPSYYCRVSVTVFSASTPADTCTVLTPL